MPIDERTSIVKLSGGLDTISSRATLFETPGKAVKMINFEGGVKGGYRRISGYSKYSALSPDGVGTTPVVAARSYRTGCVAVQGGNVYFSETGSSWLQVNKDTSGAFVDAATLAGLSALTRNSNNTEHYRFVDYHNGAQSEILFVDTLGSNPIGRLVIRDNAGLEYKYEHAEEDSWGVGNTRYPTTIEVHNERLVVSGDLGYKNEVYYSDLLDPMDFINGGVFSVADEVVWCETFRENLIVFGRNLIKGVAGLGDPSLQNIEAITNNIGCAAGGSVQEVAGGLIFLAPDGLRTVSATSRIDDFELGTLTTNIHDEILDIVSRVPVDFLTSTVVRSRNQYRLFLSGDTGVLKGLGGVIRGADPANMAVEWNTFQGNGLYDVTSTRDDDNKEVLYQVNADGFVYLHDDGDTFDGANISASFQTADMILEEPNFRKTLHYVDSYVDIEGNSDYSFKILYDQQFGTTPSPSTYDTDVSSGLSIFGVATFGSGATFGGGRDVLLRTPVQGSGKLVSFLFQSNGSSAPFTIQALNISYFLNGRY